MENKKVLTKKIIKSLREDGPFNYDMNSEENKEQKEKDKKKEKKLLSKVFSDSGY